MTSVTNLASCSRVQVENILVATVNVHHQLLNNFYIIQPELLIYQFHTKKISNIICIGHKEIKTTFTISYEQKIEENYSVKINKPFHSISINFIHRPEFDNIYREKVHFLKRVLYSSCRLNCDVTIFASLLILYCIDIDVVFIEWIAFIASM